MSPPSGLPGFSNARLDIMINFVVYLGLSKQCLWNSGEPTVLLENANEPDQVAYLTQGKSRQSALL